MSVLRVTSIRSWAGRPERQRATLRGLGLRKLNDQRLLPDSAPVMGMVLKIPHLVSWERIEGARVSKGRPGRRPKAPQSV
jgi:large subunit ribosomal protein L30